MPKLTRLCIKTALVYLVLALGMGVLQAIPTAGNAVTVVSHLRPVYFHLFMVGWVMQLIIGVGYWMFPKYSSERRAR